jgi:hypothetical protein
MSRALVGLFVFLNAALAALLWYSYPFWLKELEPNGSIIFNLIPEIIIFSIEVIAILGLLKYLDDKRWKSTRLMIVDFLCNDAKSIAAPLENFILAANIKRGGGRLYGKQLDKYWGDLHKALTDKSALERLQMLTSALTPELASTSADYFDSRWRLGNCLKDLDRKRFWELIVLIDYEKDTPERLASAYTRGQLHASFWAGQHLRALFGASMRDLGVRDDFLQNIQGFFGHEPKLEAAMAIKETLELADLSSGEQI